MTDDSSERPSPDSVERDGWPVHAYPRDVAVLVRRHWRERRSQGIVSAAVPPLAALVHVLSVCYQASLLREEGRAITFRLAVDDPGRFPASAGPPLGLHRLMFTRPRPLDVHELRRLAPAAVFARSLIGVSVSRHAGRVWGLLHSGTQWLEPASAAPADSDVPLPLLIVSVTGPGRLMVMLGGIALAELRHGRLGVADADVFAAPWLLDRFAGLGAAEHAPQAIGDRPDERARFGSRLACHVLRRAVAIMRTAQHGGMLIIRHADYPSRPALRTPLRIKYRFEDDEPRRRVETTALRLTRVLMAAAGQGGEGGAWEAFLHRRRDDLRDDDAALRELAHLIAGLSQVDGAVVLTTNLEIVGFGAEIAGQLPPVGRVAHAHDIEGSHRTWVRADRVGTRHRSAYRLCNEDHDALVLVVSQDGGLRVVRWHLDGVTYWEHVATGAGER